MEPTKKKKHPNPIAAAKDRNHNHRPPASLHPLPDPDLKPAPAFTIHSLSQRFSKLYANHRGLGSKPHPRPPPDPEDFVAAKGNSCIVLTKSSSIHEIAGRGHVFSSKVRFKETDSAEKPRISSEDSTKLSSVEKKEVLQSMPRSLEIEEEIALKEGRRISISSFPSPLMVPGGRQSFCSSQAELADFFSSSGSRALAVDMPPFMQIHAVDCARRSHDSLEKFTSKTLALTIKKEFDGVYGPAWHCIVGTSFGSFVTHSVGGFIYFSLDHKLHILLFKTAVQRAD